MCRSSVLMLIAVLSLVGCGQGRNDSEPTSDQAAAQANLERMADEHRDDQPVASPAAAQLPAALPVFAERIAYGEVELENVVGYLAMPEDITGPLPGLIVIHEWWGLNENIENMAKRLAGLGYVALAVDLYGGRVAETPETARDLAQGLIENSALAEANLREAYNYLNRFVGSQRIGVIGWCRGGGWSLNTALMLPDELDAAVIYYGRLVQDEQQLRSLNTPVLGIFGAEDRAITTDSVGQFRTTMRRLGKTAWIHVYDGAGHAFANPSGTSYRAAAAEDAWVKTVEFLQLYLGA